MPDLLLYGDTIRNPALRHEVPVAIMDPFLYAEVGGRPHVLTSPLERERLEKALPGAEFVDGRALGFLELLETGITRDQIDIELASRMAAEIGVREAIVDFAFPLGLGERLRADGIELTVDDEAVKLRRRVKSAAELEGIRRAQEAAHAGMAAAAALLRQASPVDGTLHVNGSPLLAEEVRAALRAACAEHGAPAPPDVMVVSVWQGTGHEPGSGPLPAGLPIEVDLWPQDEASGCWADMTRTFVVGGEPPEEIRRQERLAREAIDASRAAARPGVTGRELHAITCDVFEREGYRTQRTGPGDDPSEGFQFSLGHGVGLSVHEDPSLGQSGRDPLVVGDVLAIEPGLWQRDVGGVRFEDLILITEQGCETLTDWSYGLEP
ncbi:MAG TPA: M24 family metallopeptidase [Thermoleophilaceae bacterium]|nr:M24 family metallopeptidase [Thermoleophilaceae bacterium]